MPKKVETEFSLDELARLTGRSKSWLGGLAKEKYFKPVRHGQYQLDHIVTGIIKHYETLLKARPRSQSGPGQERLIKARAEAIEQRTAAHAGKLMLAEDCEALLQLLMGSMVSMLNSLPSQLARGLATLPRDDNNERGRFFAVRQLCDQIIGSERNRMVAHFTKITDDPNKSIAEYEKYDPDGEEA